MITINLLTYNTTKLCLDLEIIKLEMSGRASIISIKHEIITSIKLFQKHYGFDWIFVVVLFLYFVIISENTPPFLRQFSLDDETIQHPFADNEQISGPMCLVIASSVPSITILLVSYFSVSDVRELVRLLHMSFLGLAVSLVLCGFLTDTLKNWIGRPRPDFLARCQPAANTPTNVLVTISVCTQENMSKLIDGFRSTPSGHASFSFSGLLYLSLWLSGQFSIFRPGVEIYRAFCAGLPIIGALYISISRTEDYRHHFIDILLGGSMGIILAWFSYRKYFPSVASEDSYIPYSFPGSVSREISASNNSRSNRPTAVFDLESQIPLEDLDPVSSTIPMVRSIS